MSVPIDKAGRLVLPKGIRERLGAHAGSEFEVTEEGGDRIVLTLHSREPTIVRKGGVLVVIPEASPSTDVAETIIDRQREERLRGLL